MSIKEQEGYIQDLKELMQKEIKILRSISSASKGLDQARNQEEKNMFSSQINSLKTSLKITSEDLAGTIEDMSVIKPLPTFEAGKYKTPYAIPVKTPLVRKQIPEYMKQNRTVVPVKRPSKEESKLMAEISDLEKGILKRLKRREKKIEKVKEKRPSSYVRASNKFFGDYSKKLVEKKAFMALRREIIKANMKTIPSSYVSLILFSTFVAVIAGFVIFLFFMMFRIGVDLPFIHMANGAFFSRFIKTFWIIFAFPLVTFIIMYLYPSLEKGYLEGKINQELPFATIHMSAISGSLVEPSKIFRILIDTGEYPFLEREFTKLINEINVYGYDFVTALRNVGFNSASTKLAELFNGIATTVNSGGNLQEFFDKRAQTLLFDYRIEREKYTKTAETFMDIYISLVIAAPMILMLLLIMMRVSGLGIALSTSSITLIMILGVATINALFLTFLQIKQPPT